MMYDRQRDMESVTHSGEADTLTGRRRRAALVAEPPAMSPLPLLLAGGVILLICMIAADRIWEVRLIGPIRIRRS